MTRDPDRLYDLLPVVHRQRDVDRGEPLRALLQVIAEQVGVIEDDLDRQYANWFIETCDDWVVPYIGALIGYQASPQVAEDGGRTRLLSSVLTPRRAVANTIRDRRRKGALPLLELIARDTADWPVRVVEFYRLLSWMQPINHHRITRGRTADLRDGLALAHLGGPFDPVARNVDVRGIASGLTSGTHNIPHVGVYAWRLKPYAIEREPAYAEEAAGSGAYAFSVLGNDVPLFTLPVPEPGPDAIAEAPNVPAPILRRVLARSIDTYYGPEKSFAIWAEDWPKWGEGGLIPADSIKVADLSGWHYRPDRNDVAVDPELGRLMFHSRQAPGGEVQVRYHYGFSDDAGGVYPRPPRQPAGAVVYSVGEGATFPAIGDALATFRGDDPDEAVIEIVDGGVYTERLNIDLRPRQSLQIRARNGSRAVVRLLDYQAARGDAMVVRGESDSRFALDGIILAGRSLQCRGPMAELRLTHASLVPGWEIGPDCSPERPAEPSMELVNGPADVTIERSIFGSTQVSMDEVSADPVAISVTDSIIDATSDTREAIGAPSWPLAHATLRIVRSTIIGTVQTHAIELAEDSIFTGNVHVARRQIGCVRFCHVPAGSRTPRRYRCQPDLAEAAALEQLPAAATGGPIFVPILVGGDPADAVVEPPEAANLRLRLETSNAAPTIGEKFTLTLSIDNLGPRAAKGIAIELILPHRSDDPSEIALEPDIAVIVSSGALLVDDDEPLVWEIARLRPGGCAVLTAIVGMAAVAEPPKLGAVISAYTFADDGAAYRDGLLAAARSAIRPVFADRRYGRPAYCQLDLCTDPCIREGASDASEMGAFHDLFQPQRRAALSARLIDNVPAGMTAGLIFAN